MTFCVYCNTNYSCDCCVGCWLCHLQHWTPCDAHILPLITIFENPENIYERRVLNKLKTLAEQKGLRR